MTVEEQAKILTERLTEYTTHWIWWFPNDTEVRLLIWDTNKTLISGFTLPVTHYPVEDGLAYPYAIAKIHPNDWDLKFPEGWDIHRVMYENQNNIGMYK
jgi:hypothetical protein